MRRDPKRPKRDPLDNPEMVWNRHVRAHAEESGLTFAEIARRAEIPERRLRRMLGGHTHLRVGELHALALALGKKLEAMFHAPGQRRAA